MTLASVLVASGAGDSRDEKQCTSIARLAGLPAGTMSNLGCLRPPPSKFSVAILKQKAVESLNGPLEGDKRHCVVFVC